MSNWVVSTVAGGVDYGSNDGTGSAATFQSPSGIAVDTHDEALNLADYNSIRRVTTTGVVTTVVKPGATLSASDSFGITYDPVDGNLYLASPADDTIYKVAPQSGSIVATACQCYSAGIPALGACDPLQRDVLSGSLYVTDSGNNIRQIDLLGNVTTLAGSGVTGTVDGAGKDAEFEEPIGLTYAAASRTAYAINDSDGERPPRFARAAGRDHFTATRTETLVREICRRLHAARSKQCDYRHSPGITAARLQDRSP